MLLHNAFIFRSAARVSSNHYQAARLVALLPLRGWLMRPFDLQPELIISNLYSSRFSLAAHDAEKCDIQSLPGRFSFIICIHDVDLLPFEGLLK